MFLLFACVFLLFRRCAPSNDFGALNATERKINLDCGGIFDQQQFVIESPDYPANYPHDSDCSYILKGPSCPTTFTLQPLDFNIESSLGCSGDRLEIQDKDALCGNEVGTKNYSVADGVLQLRFRSDARKSGKGFRILVSRSPCNLDDMPGNPPLTTPPTTLSYLPPNQKQFCCSNSYSAKRFFLSSPGFPYSNIPTDCVYHIHKTNRNVCRLRMHFLFFWSGIHDPRYGCPRGFLKVDGKYLCGCRIGLKIISAFDEGAVKVIRFKNDAFPKSIFSGFVLEVIQDECPKRLNGTAGQEQFHYYNDQNNRVAWPELGGNLKKAISLSENTEIVDDSQLIPNSNPVVKNVYFFKDPSEDYDNRPDFYHPRDVEQTSYLDTAVDNFLLPDGNDNYKCRAWGVLQWLLLSKQILWQQMPRCEIPSKNPPGNCMDLIYAKGYFQSPGYPHYYTNDLNVCYRIIKQPGYCSLQIKFVDFDLENSYECRKDYLLASGYRYCGSSLSNIVANLDLRAKKFEEIKFVSDGDYCGRGFKALYEQIACTYPGHPVDPTHPTTPPTTTTTSTPRPVSCDRTIPNHAFVLDVENYSPMSCNFDVLKSNRDVCVLELVFVAFESFCDEEYFLIDGRKYCGKLSGTTIYINFDAPTLRMVYRGRGVTPSGRRMTIRLKGHQIRDSCDYPEVPAERLLRHNSSSTSTGFGTELNETAPLLNETYSDKRKHENVCGVLLNVTEINSTQSICSILLMNRKETECTEITPNLIYLPYDNSTGDTIDIHSNDSAVSLNKIEYEEVSCDDVPVV